jgi:hypothetical protein
MTDISASTGDVSMDGAAQDAANVRAAGQLRRERPGWVVVWSAPLRRFSASPLFRAPRGTFLTADTPGELADQMNQVQQASRGYGARSRHMDL